jgi:hypothetical protein
MGELMDVGAPGLVSGGMIPLALAAGAVVLYGLFSKGPENDDDDSSPGGGLMQPVA